MWLYTMGLTALADGTVSEGQYVSELGYAYGFRVLIVGVLVVFSVLALLWGVLSISRIFFYDIPRKKKAAASAAKTPVVASEESTAPETDEGALVAVITAAVAAAMEAEGNAPAGGFRVVSFRRTGNGQWNR